GRSACIRRGGAASLGVAGGDAAPCKRPAHATAYQLACARISGPASCTCACPACTAAGAGAAAPGSGDAVGFRF
ncbi:hypothetical protein, partial [Ruthenibacterium lactatiformans]|uniref:hypothetical protein n=1 Tax=Ruthenibacterium lactatiformans TaxID=1550024 RepID=UPI0022E972C4